MKPIPILFVASAVVALSGCSLGGETELQQWMAEARQGARSTVRPVPEPKVFTPQAFDTRGMVDPFDPQKVAVKQARSESRPTGLGGPNMNRRREALEAFPLDQVRMVGMIQRAGSNIALLESGGTVHMARVGNHVGQNFGLITGISETEVQLKEIVQDAAGDWVERPARLELQEQAASSQQRSKR
jgi:type IV pilus assembly protein PilP